MSSVDVVIPCYRYGHFLRECVESVLMQDVSDLRVLIIDDASPDNTEEVGKALAAEDARVTFSRHDVNKGHIATYNEGIEWVAADFMLLLSADDYLLPGSLRRAIDLIASDQRVGFVFGNAVLNTDGVRSGRMWNSAMRVDANGIAVLEGAEFIRICAQQGATNVVPTATAVVRSQLLKRLGGYRAELPHTGDLEMWLRFAVHSSVGFLAFEQAVYRMHGHNMSLSYQRDKWLPDLIHRKSAFDVFYEGCPIDWKHRDVLYAELSQSLAKTAMGYALNAFNENIPGLSQRLAHFARSVDPRVSRTLKWKYLEFKQRFGFRMDKPLLSAFRRVRRTLKVRS